MPSKSVTVQPNGLCFCDCGLPTQPGSFFMQGHDKRAQRYLEAYNGAKSIAERLAQQGFIPGGASSLRTAVLDTDPTYEVCGRRRSDGAECRVIGRSTGMRRHRADDTQHQ